jgi:hypothetical protein
MAAGINSLDFQLEGASEQENAVDDDLPALARKLGIPYLALLPRKLPREVRQLVRPELALELHCYPLGRERDTLTVAIADPQDSQMFDRLRKETGLRIFPVLAHPQELHLVLSQQLLQSRKREGKYVARGLTGENNIEVQSAKVK